MPTNPPSGLGHVSVAVYACSATATAVRDGERRGRHYADARHWHVAGAWSDTDPTVSLAERPGWQAIASALSTGMIRGIIVGSISHVASDTAQFAGLGVIIRDRGGFLVHAADTLPRRTPGQLQRRRVIADASSEWSPWEDTPRADTP
ncbi:hypothetical protein J7F03_33030 [Streptomyces sp. ISL-43]|uniref:hypothetical protein n=1 Tax=Streptomyces sp. ISL-43 TaxID=2819183 RepID=UPI001BE7F683|nr:hypothetical protein [Streptomyces sp. ISL-43]MBT2451805.1 hypothetical protein [Streptomyces sp. ISL-43]